MLQGFRKIGQSFVGRTVITVMFGLLIVSFAIWGIGDIFRATPQGAVAKVGSTQITAEAVRSAYQNEVQRLSRQVRQTITPERARLLGIDAQVLSRLVTEAVLDEKAKDLNLAVSDQLVARSIMEEPSFKGPSGQFDRAQFDDLLRNNGLTEAAFVRDQRSTVTRVQLAEALTGALPVPFAAREALHRYGAERRSAAYMVLGPAAAGDIPAPTEDELKTFFEDRKASFRAPDYRALGVLALEAPSLAKPDQVSDADARTRYDEVKGSRFGTPEKRTIQQIPFPDQPAAEAAFARIKDGTAFETIAAERNVDPKTLELGTYARSEMFDKAAADAAFALPEGGVSGPVQSRFGPVLLRVTKVEPERVKPFEEVKAEIQGEIALERARKEIDAVHDAIEDARASARPLADIAREKGLPLVAIPAADRAGRDKAGQPIAAFPDRDAVLAAAFASDVGVDNEPLRLRNGGYVWFEVTGIEPSRDKTLAEVREEVARQWQADEVARRLAEKARGAVERLDKGETVEALAGEFGVPAKTADEIARAAPKDDLGAEVATRIFATPVGKAGSAASGDGRAVFKVTGAAVPPLVTSTEAAQRLEERLRVALSDDILSQYIAQAQQEIGVVVNQDAFRRAIGGEY